MHFLHYVLGGGGQHGGGKRGLKSREDGGKRGVITDVCCLLRRWKKNIEIKGCYSSISIDGDSRVIGEY